MKIENCQVTVNRFKYEVDDWLIRARVIDMFTNLFYYDRKDDEELRVGVLEECIEKGYITKQQIHENWTRNWRMDYNERCIKNK